jgi:hypothetical protein
VVKVESTSRGTRCRARSRATRGDVQHVEPGIAQRFAEQQPVFGRIAARQASMIARLDEGRLDAEARSV